MNLRLILLLLLALGAAAATTFYVREWLQSERTEMEQQKRAEPVSPKILEEPVLVAAQDLDAGTILKPVNLSWEPWPKQRIANSYIVQSQEQQGLQEAVGGVIRHPLVSGTPVARSMYVQPGEQGFLAAVLKPGMRAVSAPVSNAAVLSGLVFPGDHVDIILSHTVAAQTANDRAGGEVQASETVLSNVRVVALDQRLSNPDNEPQDAQTVTLEVTPKQAEKVSLAQQLGQLRLSLRSVADTKVEAGTTPDIPSFTLGSEISGLIGRFEPPTSAERETEKTQERGEPERSFAVDIVRGTEKETRAFDEGAKPGGQPVSGSR